MKSRPKRVLQVVHAMNRAGVETWLMDVVRRLDRRRLQMDFLVRTTQPGDYDAELLERGSRLIRCPGPAWSPAYPLRIGGILRQFGPYDAVHSHLHHFGGYVLDIARRAGVPARIAHSHSDTSRLDARSGWPRRCYLRLASNCIQSNATRLVGVSRVAARALFGDGWERDRRSLLLHCGIDLTRFGRGPDRAAVRALWNIGERELVIGHVGRFEMPKNHAFLLEVAAEAIRRKPGTRLLLVGDGSLRRSIEERARSLGIARNLVFTGVRSDVPSLLSAMDAFAFPSVCEGLPLALLEAQAAGRPCAVSDVVSDETDIVPGLVDRIPLARGAGYWADRVLTIAERPSHNRYEALSLLEKSSFNISHSVEQLYALYDA